MHVRGGYAHLMKCALRSRKRVEVTGIPHEEFDRFFEGVREEVWQEEQGQGR